MEFKLRYLVDNFDDFFSAIQFGQSLYRKTSAILSANSKNLTKEQISSLNQMISKLNENITQLVGGRELEDFKTNETAVEQVKLRRYQKATILEKISRLF